MWGLTYFLLVKLIGQEFTAYMYLTSAFLSGIPGIICQLIIIPIIAVVINKSKLVIMFDNTIKT